MGSEWTTAEQKDYLESLMEEYVKYAPMKRYGKFWAQVNETWLRRWPIQPELIAEEPSDGEVPTQLSLQQRRDKLLALAIDSVQQVSIYIFLQAIARFHILINY